MAIATIELAFRNPSIYEKNVKITKGDVYLLNSFGKSPANPQIDNVYATILSAYWSTLVDKKRLGEISGRKVNLEHLKQLSDPISGEVDD
jgi:hypothetical protein